MQPKLKLKLQLQVQEVGVISGFCYPYARLLLDKAIALKEQKGLFEQQNIDECREFAANITAIGSNVLTALQNQIPSVPTYGSVKDIYGGIENAQKFLAIFEE